MNFLQWLEATEESRKEKVKQYLSMLQNKTIVNNDYSQPPKVISGVLGSGFKPQGNLCWYGCGPSWLEFTITDFMELRRFIHEIKVDTNKILVIKSKKEYYNFLDRYEVSDDIVNWDNVKKDGHSGIDFCHWFVRSGLLNRWDVPQGVIWDQSAILSSQILIDLDS